MNDAKTDQQLAAFLADLDKGLETYRKGGAKKQRTGVLQQFSAIIEWAECAPGVKERLAPLHHLFKALVGIDTGYRDHLLVPPIVGHRTPLSTQEQGRRAIVSVLMDFYMQADESKEEAARHSARSLNTVPGFENLAGRTVAKWREAVMTKSSMFDLGAARFKRMVETLKTKFPGEPRKAAEYLIAALKRGPAL